MNDVLSVINKNSPTIRNRGLILSSFKKIEKGENDVIEKSVVDSLSYNQDIKIEKTGKEIKESLTPVRSNVENEKNQHYQNMMMYKKEAGIEPEENSNYYYDEISKRIDSPKMYSYNQRYGKGDLKENVITYPKVEPETVTKEQIGLMDKYNNCARQYVKCMADLITIDTLTKNLSDNKKIALTVQQASALGF